MKKKVQSRKNNYFFVVFVAFFLVLILSRGFAKSSFPKFPNEALAVTGTLNINATTGTAWTPGGIWKSDGSVGIGTTGPGYKLDVQGSALRLVNGAPSTYGTRTDSIIFNRSDLLTQYSNKITNSMSSDTSLTTMNFELTNGAGSGWTNTMTLLGNGNVGIGTTSPGAKLDVSTLTNAIEVARFGTSAGGSGAVQGLSYIGLTPWSSGAYPHAWIGVQEDSVASYRGALTFGTRGADSDSAPSERMRIDSAGNVGIGTTAPGALLDVKGASTGRTLVGVLSDSTGYGAIGFQTTLSAANYAIAGTSAITLINAPTDAPISFNINNAEKMRVNSDGSIGIGTTAPGAALEIYWDSGVYNPAAYMAGQLTLNMADTVGDYTGIRFRNAAGSAEKMVGAVQTTDNYSDIVFQGYDRAGGVYKEYMRIKDNGSIGIGTTNPLRKLHVNGTLYSSVAASDTIDWLANFMGSGGYWDIRTGANNRMAIDVYNSNSPLEAFTILQSGNVGIGTTAPTRALDVVGSITASAAYYSGVTAGVSCTTTPSKSSFGIVTSCSASSLKYKTNISDLNLGLDAVMKLRPVAFDWKTTYNGYEPSRQFGFIAEEVEQVNPLFVYHNPDGTPESVKYEQLTSLLTNAIQEQQTEIISLKSTMTDFITQFKAGLIETKKLIVDGVDILKKLNELSDKSDKQQQTIEAQQKQIKELKILIKTKQ